MDTTSGSQPPRTSGTSKFEIRLRAELGTFFASENSRRGRTIRLDRDYLRADIVLRELGLIVEFDSSYYHASPERAGKDASKAERLRQAGWDVIRVREEPLGALSDSDVVVPARASVHTVTVTVLEQIERFGTPVPELAAYRAAGRTRMLAASSEVLDAEFGVALTTPELLNALCGGPHWQRFHEGLRGLEAAIVCERAAYLYEVCGKRWQSYPSLLGCDREALRVKVEWLDRRFGRRWRKKQPSLLGRNLATLSANEAYLDELFGDASWHSHLRLPTMRTGTLRARAAYLDALVRDRRWIEQPQLLTRNSYALARTARFLDELFGNRPWRGQIALVGRKIETLQATADYLNSLFSLFPDRTWLGRPQLLKLAPKTLKMKADCYARLTSNAPLSPGALTLSADTMASRARELAAQVGPRRAARWLHETPYLLEDPRACARRVARWLLKTGRK